MNEELLEKARAAKSPEELLALARENGMEEFTEENAKAYFEAMSESGEIADEEMDVSAGSCCAVRAHGQKMVALFNSCSHYRCGYALDLFFKVEKKRDVYLPEDQLEVDKYMKTWDNTKHCFVRYIFYERQCKNCYYCSYERGAWWCNNPNHYNE